VKKLKLEVNKLKKQNKVQPPQDNRTNVVKKLNKRKPALKIAFQPLKKQVQNEKDECDTPNVTVAATVPE
jgi:hypothetical protein